ncbi:MAG: DUF4345 family protein [Anaerolineales bacterium]|jgi:hypothetical protein
MSILQILQIIGAIATIATGLLATFNPKGIEGFTGLTAPGARGITEFRSVFGGAFIGLGLAVLLIGTRDAYRTLGAMYLAIFAVRAVSMFVDKSGGVQSNIISLVIEIVFGVILVL